ncbi:hypothetical protein BU15DRAFT_82934 [Melanogaster broomeanus]|nr:hypothetical protein BU15DRAFT_82934 [Melanogaster broomeanus]
MAGANYMGGKRFDSPTSYHEHTTISCNGSPRNAARARTKDATGRAQKRHFGKQRLAAALCRTREDSVHPIKPTLSSVLLEINLAHARRYVVVDVPSPANQTLRSVRQHPSSSPDDELRRRNPSKLLVALDTSDHMSMRAAIDRILRRPDLVGLEQTTSKERAHPTMTVRSSINPFMYAHSREHPTTPSKTTIDQPKSQSDALQHGFTRSSEVNLNISCEHLIDSQAIDEGVLPTLYPPQSNSEADFWNTFDDSGYAEQQHSVNLYPHTPPPYGFKWSNNTFQEPTFPLTPCPSGSQTSDNLNTILDFDTSPLTASLRFGLSDVRTKPLRSAAFQEATCSDEEDHDVTTKPIFIHSAASSPFSSTDALEVGHFDTIYCAEPKNDCAASSTADDTLRNMSLSKIRRDSIQVSPSTGIIEDIVPNDLPLDFLSDPDPWATIGQILNLEPAEQHVEQSAEIEFTKEREGVGYDRSRMSSPSTIFGLYHEHTLLYPRLRTGWMTACYPTLRVSHGMTLSPDHLSNLAYLLMLQNAFNIASPKMKKPVMADACKRASPVGSIVATAVAEYTHAKRGRDSSSTAGATAAEVDDDVMYNGPCLFGDSDFEEDE